MRSKLCQREMTTSDANTAVDYGFVKDAVDAKRHNIVDVRSASEIEEQGSLPTAVNIPVSDIENVLSTHSPDDLKQKFGLQLPQEKNSEIIFSCRSGRRAQLAAEAAQRCGYTNTKVYLGSYSDWSEKQQQH